jgi:hypothetical protein
MEKNKPTQEILLSTASSLARGELCDNDLLKDNFGKRLSPVERLEEACWNGLLDEFSTNKRAIGKNGNQLFLWKIHVADAFLCVELAQAPPALDYYYSLDPYLFLSFKNYS